MSVSGGLTMTARRRSKSGQYCLMSSQNLIVSVIAVAVVLCKMERGEGSGW